MTHQPLFFATGGAAGFSNTRSLLMQTGGNSMARTQGAGASRRKMTFSFWMYVPSAGVGTVPLSIAGSDVLEILSAGQVCLVLASVFNGFVFSASPSFDVWTQVTVLIDTTSATDPLHIYFNGADQTLTVIFPITLNYDTAWGSNGTTETLMSAQGDGLIIDEFCRIDNALLAASNFATAGHPKDLSALTFGAQGYWTRFETGVALTVGNDSSGNANHFTNSGFAIGDFSTNVP